MTDGESQSTDDLRMCVTCGTMGGTCRLADYPVKCMRKQIANLRDTIRGYNPETQSTRYAVTALLLQSVSDGFNFQMMLDVIDAVDLQDARARFGLTAKDAWPEHALREVLAVEVVNG